MILSSSVSCMHDFLRERYVYTQLGGCSLTSLRAEHPLNSVDTRAAQALTMHWQAISFSCWFILDLLTRYPEDRQEFVLPMFRSRQPEAPLNLAWYSFCRCILLPKLMRSAQMWHVLIQAQSLNTGMCLSLSAVHMVNMVMSAHRRPCRHNLKYSPKLQPRSSFSLGCLDNFKVTIVCFEIAMVIT